MTRMKTTAGMLRTSKSGRSGSGSRTDRLAWQINLRATPAAHYCWQDRVWVGGGFPGHLHPLRGERGRQIVDPW